MKASIKLFRIAGIDVGIHYSWFFIFLFFWWTLAQGFLPQQHPGWTAAAYWITGAVTALLLFVSVLLHELSHSLVARSRGLPVSSITLFILGGVSNLEEEPKKPMVEFTMALAGPVTSLVLALIFWGITRVVGPVTEPNYTIAVIGFLAYINLVLGIFNLLPGFPMDGGRVLRSIIWGTTGSLSKATNIAARIGQAFGWLLIAYGIYLIFSVDLFSGLWAAFVGWFLTSAADASRKEVTYRERLAGVKVRELMNVNIPTITPETTVQDMVTGIFQKKHDRAVPVCRDEQLIGIATITDVKKVAQEKWAVTPVRDIMTGGNLYTVTPDDSLNTALELIAKHDINQVLIKNGEKCAGLLTRADIIRYLQMSRELGIKEKNK
jgi:Zn-dependent protease/CBS domain-containing protein